MSDLLLLLDGLMKVALVVSVMVLVATAPSSATAAAQRVAAQGALPQLEATGGVPHGAETDQWRAGSACESSGCHKDEPDAFEYDTNIDGTPMCGDTDINGNVFGITESHFDSWACTDTSSMFD